VAKAPPAVIELERKRVADFKAGFGAVKHAGLNAAVGQGLGKGSWLKQG
jgi:hypothetical protein